MNNIFEIEIEEKSWEKNNTFSENLNSSERLTLLEWTITKKNTKWRFHKNDKDDIFPSSPHGHQIGAPHKLDVYNGIVYNINTKKPVRKLNKKDLLDIQTQLKMKGFNLKNSINTTSTLIS